MTKVKITILKTTIDTHKGLMGMKRTHASDAWRVAAGE